MSEIKSWNDFLELMLHQIRDCDVDLNTDAYRVDDARRKPNGIRTHCKIDNPANNQTIKTCDYFHIISEKSLFLCVEFSDLFAQQTKRDDTIKKIRELDIDNSEKNQIIKSFNSNKVISDELAQKFRDTDFILRRLYENCQAYIKDLPCSTYEKHFLVVYYLPNADTVDEARFLDKENDKFKLQSLLATSQFTYLDISRIHSVEISDFKARYC